MAEDPNDKTRVTREPDIALSDLSNYDQGSTAPYHLFNCALNLQSSNDPTIHLVDDSRSVRLS